MKITEALLAEHLVFHNLFDHVETTAPSTQTIGELKTMAALLESVLRAHSRTEDELFMGPLEQCFEQIGHQETFHQEHDRIDEILAQVQKTLEADKARELLLSTIVLCREHFDKEERIVFPMAESLLKQETLIQLGETWMGQRARNEVRGER